MDRATIDYYRIEHAYERLSYGEVAEIQHAFEQLDPATLRDLPENAGIGDMLDELETALGNDCTECREAPAEGYGLCSSCFHDAVRSGWEPGER